MCNHTPVFIKSALALVADMLSKDGFEGTQATYGCNVSHYPHHNDWRSLNDGYRLHLLSLCLLCGRNMDHINLLIYLNCQYPVKLN